MRELVVVERSEVTEEVVLDGAGEDREFGREVRETAWGRELIAVEMFDLQ